MQKNRFPTEIYSDNLTQRDLRVFGFLFGCADENGSCCPRISTICKLTHLSKMTVYRAKERLVASGWIEVKPRYRKDGSRSSSQYIVKSR